MGETRIVYIDVLFFINFIINCALILCTAKMMSVRASHGRTAAAAALGGAYSICMFFPSFSTPAWIGLKLIFAASIVTAAFGFKNIRYLLRCTAAFLLMNLLFGGAAFALFYLTPLVSEEKMLQNNGVFYLELSLPVLLTVCAISYIILNYALYLFKRRIYTKEQIIDIRISLGAKSCMLRAMCDSGNMLKTPVEHKPVIVCELSALSDILSPQDSAALSGEGGAEPSLGIIFLPYTSLGAKNGLIPAFFADEATYYINKGELKTSKVPVAVSRARLTDDGRINALVNPAAFDAKDGEA
ncbi:MAG: sigma-E processing peptidase SpoIIGA [Clostridia bacterium]|nr:sigma-E processing peptidase SpoIIGA [Clostridia bacterium]MBQ6553786.1 sigma-E processing peptidase SpoIIGA [Bacillota bacterium]